MTEPTARPETEAAARRCSPLGSSSKPSQRRLAELAGTSAAAICLYESGRRVPRVDTLTRIVAATGSALSIGAMAPAEIDLEANGRALEELLDLADHLPRRSAPTIAAPVFASLAA